jgi:hypothetical protein
MLPIASERIIPLDQVPARLNEILRGAVGDKVWLISEGNSPKVVVVDAQFFNQLLRHVWFDELASKTHSAFRNYLIHQGLDPDRLSEQEVETLLQK